jgi:YggT family protein
LGINLISIINLFLGLLTILIFVDILLRFILDPYHPVRAALDSIVEPMLVPIRRALPPMAGFDFSPIILILVIRIGGAVLIFLLRQIGF